MGFTHSPCHPLHSPKTQSTAPLHSLEHLLVSISEPLQGSPAQLLSRSTVRCRSQSWVQVGADQEDQASKWQSWAAQPQLGSAGQDWHCRYILSAKDII